MKENQLKYQLIYETFMTVLALVSVILVFSSLFSLISLNEEPYKTIEIYLLVIFWLDYLGRLFLSNKKIEFFKENFFDLLAILPLSRTFSIFRLIRIIKLAQFAQRYKVTRLSTIINLIIKFNKNTNSFLGTNGFVYLLYCTLLLVVSSAWVMSYAENISLSDSLWWSIVTCTTVGYGDITPTTSLGRFVAVFLMIFGIAFLGMLTSTITTFVAQLAKERKNKLNSNNKENTKDTISKDYADLINIINELNETDQGKLLLFAKSLKKNK